MWVCACVSVRALGILGGEAEMSEWECVNVSQRERSLQVEEGNSLALRETARTDEAEARRKVLVRAKASISGLPFALLVSVQAAGGSRQINKQINKRETYKKGTNERNHSTSYSILD